MDDWWQRVTATTPSPDLRVTLLLALVALGCIAWAPVWRVTRHLVTVAHEGAHGLVALLAGRQLSGIRLHSDSSGLTVSRGRPNGPGMVLTLLAGYLGPSVLGLLVALGIHAGHAVGTLWALLVALALLLLQVRNLYGLWVVLVSAAALAAVTQWLDPTVQAAVAQTICSFLLIAGPWSLIDLQRSRRTGVARRSDPDQLARITRAPGTVWWALLLLISLGCLAAGGALLLR
ncbi:M50 family metallopeptidase [Flexivirga caeni]|uniref:M50 family peptidase n=1 Tax=Flexivirga caeni TaxID=2294115 RepID=A0A3M9MFQ8_9MICO|nr:M50 family metallopeptidase [Flexivirga caeni]RNI24389.1 M50 family peptidase [Flexivirga caeni]